MKETGAKNRGLRISFWCAALALGAADAWAGRFSMNPDGISYLDIGDAYWRGDWHHAVNAYWSPLYSWILGAFFKFLKPSPYWEYPLVHFVNFLIYMAALACFDFFLCAFIRCLRELRSEHSQTAGAILPEWAWWTLGYSLFIWTSLVLITVGIVTPDLCVSGFVYVAAGLVLHVHSGVASRRKFALLGAVLGFAYLAKAVMFPLAIVFLAVAMVSVGNLRKAASRVAVSAAVFFLIASPFMAAISWTKGRLTFGDSGRLNYAACINGVDTWFPGDSGTMKCVGDGVAEGVDDFESPIRKELLHPVKRIFDVPATYQFDGPVGGTYPFWYDVSYWQDGIKPHFDLKAQGQAIIRGILSYCRLYLSFFFLLNVTTGLCILYFLAPNPWVCVKSAAEMWPLLACGLSSLGLYALVNVQYRYIAPFVLILWFAAFSGVFLPPLKGSSLWISVMTVSIAATLIVSTASHVVKDSMAPSNAVPVYWQAAMDLRKLGIQPGDKIAVMAKEPMREVPFLARLAGTEIIAQVNRPDRFFAAGESTQIQVMEAIARSGAKAIITPAAPPSAAFLAKWQQLKQTNYYACRLEMRRP